MKKANAFLLLMSISVATSEVNAGPRLDKFIGVCNRILGRGLGETIDTPETVASRPVEAKSTINESKSTRRIYNEPGSYGLKELTDARTQPMVPVQASGGAYIVYSSADTAGLWSGYIEHYSVFSDGQKAQEFVKTHRFVVGQH